MRCFCLIGEKEKRFGLMHEKRSVMLIHVQDCRGEESKKDNVTSEENSRGQQLIKQLQKSIGGRLLLLDENRVQLHYSVFQAVEMLIFSLFSGDILVKST